MSAVDKSRDSKSAEVRRVWEVHDERLQLNDAGEAFRLDEALVCGDISRAWFVWSHAAAAALADAYRLAREKGPSLSVGLDWVGVLLGSL